MKKKIRCATVLLMCLAAYGQMQKGSAAGGEREVVESKDAPKAIGPYSQAIKAGGLVFCAGQIALDPRPGNWLRATSRPRPIVSSRTSPQYLPLPALTLTMRSKPLYS